jgi:hypothetical protein
MEESVSFGAEGRVNALRELPVQKPHAAKFCIECGAPFSNRCPQCRAENMGRAKFCIECGISLAVPDTAAAPERTTLEHHEANDGERRHLTVLFCDLVGSTAIAAQLDSEEGVRWSASTIARRLKRSLGLAATSRNISVTG